MPETNYCRPEAGIVECILKPFNIMSSCVLKLKVSETDL